MKKKREKGVDEGPVKKGRSKKDLKRTRKKKSGYKTKEE